MNRYKYTVILDGKRYPVSLIREYWFGGCWTWDHDREYWSLEAVKEHVKELGGSVERKQNKDWKPTPEETR